MLLDCFFKVSKQQFSCEFSKSFATWLTSHYSKGEGWLGRWNNASMGVICHGWERSRGQSHCGEDTASHCVVEDDHKVEWPIRLFHIRLLVFTLLPRNWRDRTDFLICCHLILITTLGDRSGWGQQSHSELLAHVEKPTWLSPVLVPHCTHCPTLPVIKYHKKTWEKLSQHWLSALHPEYRTNINKIVDLLISTNMWTWWETEHSVTKQSEKC